MTAPTSAFALLGAAGLALVPVVAPAAERPGVWRLHEEHVLGAPANFIVTATDEESAATAVLAARAEIERLDGLLNSRREGAELFELNRARDRAVSPELFEVLSLAERLRDASGGAYDGRLGEPLRLWRAAVDAPPVAAELALAVEAARAEVVLDPSTRTVHRPAGVIFDVDSVAKGYIVDRALEAGLAAAPVAGMAVDIGGDLRCAGCAPDGLAWSVDIPDAARPQPGAPIVAEARLNDRAVATSGKGPRDFTIAGQAFSATLSPATGCAAKTNLSATVIAATAAEADGLATALLVMDAEAGVAFADAWPGAEARITDSGGKVFRTARWSSHASEPPLLVPALGRVVAQAAAKTTDPANRWMADWAVQIVYNAPRRAVERREADFRTPYMAMWITDKNNNPIRTLVLVGTRPEWHRDNYIWWNMYKDKAENLIRLRSTATALSGAYPTYWPGYNDDWKFVTQGEYVLHVETSRERGRHTYRTAPLSLGTRPFTTSMPPTEEGGGMTLTYAKRE